MKYFFKVFLIALLCFVVAAGAGVFTYYKFYDAEAKNNEVVDGEVKGNEDDEEDDDIEEITDPLQKAIAESDRVNFLLLGMEGTRSDTMIFASFDKKTKNVDLISVPRDTYYLMPDYAKNAGDRKINAVYGKKGVKGTVSAVEEILGGVPIDHYVMVDYEGVEKIVDALGGVEVDVPFHMQYEDTTAGQPPLYIDIQKGKQVLNGEQSVKYLRWRHNNDMTVGYPDGDLGRIKAQQKFIASAVKKSLSLKLPSVVKACFTYVKTDVGLGDALSLAANALGLEMDKISMTTLPGIDDYKTINGTRLSFYNHDPEKIKELVMDLYNVEEESTETANEN